MTRTIKNFFVGLLLLLLLLNNSSKAQTTTFYDINTIQKIEVFFTPSDWDYQMDTAIVGAAGYLLADSVKINGLLLDSVGVKYKGNSSYNSTYAKNPLHITIDQYKNQSYQGVTDIKLSNEYSDPSMIREALAYSILNNYMDCPRSNFSQVYINGTYIGLYSNTEPISKNFCSNHFYSSENTFVKCNPIVTPGPTTKCNLKYITTGDSTAYFNFYEIKSTSGWNELVKLCDTVTNSPSNVSSIMDMDRAMWMLSFDNELVNLDSYTGAFCQNYYLYKDNNHRFNPIIWDMNMAFGGFPFVGAGYTSMGTLTLSNMQQLSPTIHSADPYWPLLNDVMNNAMYKRMYMAHMRTINNEMFLSNLYQTTATSLQATIDTAVLSDVNKFFSYTDFQNGMTANVISGSNTIPGISNLMSVRQPYLSALADLSALPPTISAITSSSLAPPIASSVTISANVINTNTNGVYLGYRMNMQEKFTRIPMFDDGLHNDGAAGDNVYGAAFTMFSAQAQYYIYAENNTAGMFSPERAEHEFYLLQSNVLTASLGEVVINEFMANNLNMNLSEYGLYGDWIELFNTTSSALDLFGLYLTDNFSTPTKFAFPANTVIPANGYLIVWADQNPTTASYIHANFKLSASGEEIMLSNSTGVVFDSITYGPQNPNVAFARCANGTGNFTTLYPTFASWNCITSISENPIERNDLLVYPNPANKNVTVQFISKEKENTISIYNALGQEVINKISNYNVENIDISKLNAGVYSITINHYKAKQLVIVK
ncbi:MAG: CotH kinase family protein [Bacteroidetes bacterium]|nr:CotH kinase family protein [Bacteroidota bacterium]